MRERHTYNDNISHFFEFWDLIVLTVTFTTDILHPYCGFRIESIARKSHAETSNHNRETLTIFPHVGKAFHPIRNQLSKWIDHDQFSVRSRYYWRHFDLHLQNFVRLFHKFTPTTDNFEKFEQVYRFRWTFKSTFRNSRTIRLEQNPWRRDVKVSSLSEFLKQKEEDNKVSKKAYVYALSTMTKSFTKQGNVWKLEVDELKKPR